jgi:probable rRNA maturation factor
MFEICINNQQDKIELSESKLEELIKSIFEAGELEQTGELSVTLVDDEEMRKLNLEYRNIDKTTDVLSFPQDEGMEMAVPDDSSFIPLIGDVIISVPTAAKQAEESGHSIEKEITILLIHGILHLFGYDHDNVYQQTFMQEEEKEILQSVMNKGNRVVCGV